MPEETSRKTSSRADLGTLGGIALAVISIVGGLILEKGSPRDIAQLTAALIVVGGTCGATLVNTPLPIVRAALKRLASVFLQPPESPDLLLDEIIAYATKARKFGLVALETEAAGVADPFLRKALTLAVDGADLQEIRKMLELELIVREHEGEAEARVFECAGGYSPTIGIIGAVLGLIQVMKNLSNIDEVGHGIAVAFVATVYGVALANLFLLPAANRIKARVQRETQMRELILEGVSGIVEGLNPKLIRGKLEAYLPQAPAPNKKADESARRTQPVEA